MMEHHAPTELRKMKILKPILLLGCLIPCAAITQNDTELVSKSIFVTRRFVVSHAEFHRVLQLAEDGTYSWTQDENAVVLLGKWKEIGPNAEDGPGTTRISLDNVPSAWKVLVLHFKEGKANPPVEN